MLILWRRISVNSGLGHCDDVAAVDPHLAARRLDQPRDAAHQSRFAGAGKPHDDEGLAFVDLESDVLDRNHVAGALLDLVPVRGGIETRTHPCRVGPEDLPHAPAHDLGAFAIARSVHSPSPPRADSMIGKETGENQGGGESGAKRLIRSRRWRPER